MSSGVYSVMASGNIDIQTIHFSAMAKALYCACVVNCYMYGALLSSLCLSLPLLSLPPSSLQNGMIPLYGAVLHKCVDVEGQPIGSDLQSGRSEDKLAFGLSLVNNDNLYLRAARPNEWKQWVEQLERVRKYVMPHG